MEHRFPQSHLAARQQDPHDEAHRLGRLGEEVHGAVGDAHNGLALHALLPNHAADPSVSGGQNPLQGEHPYHGYGAQGLYQEGGGTGYLRFGPPLQPLCQRIQVQGQRHVDAAVCHPRHRDMPVPSQQHPKGDRKDHHEPDQVHHQKGIEHCHGPLRIAGKAGDVIADPVPGQCPAWHMEDMAEEELAQPHRALGGGGGLQIFAVYHRRHQQQEHGQHAQQGQYDIALAGPCDDIDEFLIDVRHGEQDCQLKGAQGQATQISLPGRAQIGEASDI